MNKMLRRALIVTSLLGFLSGCGGGGGGGFASTPSSAGGLWSGTVSADGIAQPMQILGIVSETREFHFLRDDGTQYYGMLTITGNRGTATFTGLPPPGTTFVDGSTRGSGSLNVTIQQRSQLTATGTFTTANNNTSNVSMTVQYQHDYDPDSSLSAVEGSYTNANTPGSDVLSISSGQVTYAQGTCNATGTVSIIDAQWNLYRIQVAFGPNCQIGGVVLSGVTLDGLLTIDATQNPALMAIFMHGTVQGGPAAVIWVAQKT